MKIRSIDAIKEFTRLSGKQFSIQTKRQEIPKMKKAFCFTVKERAIYYYGYPKDYFGKYVYNIESLQSTGKGTGTSAIKDVVKKSLADPDAQGRVTLLAADIDKSKPHPFNFYYKLGFRAADDYYNTFGVEGKPMYPGADIYMYLPKENIKQCLNYKNSADAGSSGLKYIYDKMR